MNVLSLFDGLSCGQIALNNLGFKIDNYYASEIDEYAINITMKNYPKTIQLGDICKIQGKDLPKIDLLIGGSPCQGFSFAGKQLNFEDPRSKLFFEYVRLLKEINPKYFLLENVIMKKEYEKVITEALGVEPIKINSKLITAQNRNRLYWTNIPNITIPDDLNITLKEILEKDVEDKYYLKKINMDFMHRYFGDKERWMKFKCEYDGKAGCITASHSKGLPRGVVRIPIKEFGDLKRLPNQDCVKDGFVWRRLTPLECEKLQTIPDNFTDGVSTTRRYHMIGNGWTVDVISHIFKNIKV